MRTLFEARSFDQLRREADRFPRTQLQPGSPFIVELDLRQPLGPAFDLAGAEAVFRPFVPEGLELVDVRSAGQRRAVVELRVRNDAEAGAGQVPMAAPIALAAVLLFIAANWKFISLVAIGIFLSLGFLVSAIRGRGVIVGPQLSGLALAGAGLAAVVLLTRSER